MSAEMATSPATFADWRGSDRDETKGNDSTSVGLFCLRNWRFSERTAALPVTSTFTCPRTPTALRTRSTKFRRAFSVNPATFFFRITNLFSTTLLLIEWHKIKQEGRVGPPAQSVQTIPWLRPTSPFVRARPLRSPRRRPAFRRSRRQRAWARPAKASAALRLASCAHRRLERCVAPDDVARRRFRRSVQMPVRPRFQHIHCLEQPAAASIGQIDLCNVAGNHGFRVEPETRDEHLHLFRCGVLRFVENDE